MATAGASYSGVAKLLHWLIAVLVLGLIVLGLVMKRGTLAFADKIWAYQLHKSLGMTVLALMVLRVIWRLTHRPPTLADATPRLQRLAAHLTHAGLYLLLLAMPLSGWLMVSAATIPVPTRMFGWIPVPALPGLVTLQPAVRKVYEGEFRDFHLAAAIALGLLALLHVSSALYHHFGRRDDILRRMLPGKRLLLAVAVVSLAVCNARDAGAVEWRVDLAKSKITFECNAGGTTVSGRFMTFTPRIEFDPQQPEAARVRVEIAVASLASGNDEVDVALRDAIWLDAKGFPTATYRAERAEQLPDGRYQLQGALTLRGKTMPLALPFTFGFNLSMSGGKATVSGEIILSRKAFDVGPGAPVAGLIIADEVKVRLMLEAEPGG